ncbi:tRNA nucleotidyltransferase [Bathymodiolus thermophilus thioautotrophic gill symbiont]|uniref:polynucleotide adenylyltransferase n=1 Tax=Bathymodiolus thermophilus thioautotrophic gill symbiont TaxID=2360 RepID=UPI0010B0F89B|nr:polynucleotide adenylyltransferase [Bathymodiolus thermophilus thioautotrophic gill symbiont]CAB5503437.1 CCA tRNA nucleotidyltransferase (EC [Bathymodiolus thermophilus thioautotrophic gill symbiont]SGZ62174.1 tRNA nucleotidyltransferase [Bathymodiolus thermophilus thioautotrophic gill symbiont]
MKKYLVGGAVRDQLLGIANEHTEKDWLIVGSSPEEMLDLGYRQVGKEFPVFLHPGTQEEYALARVERKVGKGYKGFEFDTSKSVTLEQDLSRRDLTINAIAQKNDELFDPFNGQVDLDNGLLKHVSVAFVEDPVRILRVARFAAQFKAFGFKVAHETHQLMKDMVVSGEVDALTPERVFKELDKSLAGDTPAAFFKVLSACGAYEKVFSPLKSCPPQNHQNAFEFLDNLPTSEPAIKFSIWLKDEDPKALDALCKHIKCPKKYEQLAKLVNTTYQFAAKFKTQSSDEVFNFFAKTDALRRQERFAELLTTFALIGIDVSRIVELKDLLNAIDTSSLDKHNIAQVIQQQKLSIIEDFV